MKRTKLPTKQLTVVPKSTPRPNGRPPKYSTPEEMQVAIDAYFDSCFESEFKVVGEDENGKKIYQEFRRQVTPFTVTGLALALDMARVQLIYYTNEKPEFANTILRAKQKCELYAEQQLYMGKASPSGVIFAMTNNFKDWNQTTRQEISGPNGQPIQSTITMNDERARQTRASMLAALGEEEGE